jgi:ribosomal protein S18 acetylase RimI-like enzyme
MRRATLPLKIEGPNFKTASNCEPILRSLPAWFGIETELCQYVRDIDCLPTFLAWQNEKVAGFLTLKQHNPLAAEVLVMGVMPTMQGLGIGSGLMQKAEMWLCEQGVLYLQVKTLGPSCDDEHYARTRAFYEAMGFVAMEELKQIWDEANPCLIMVKKLDMSLSGRNY